MSFNVPEILRPVLRVPISLRGTGMEALISGAVIVVSEGDREKPGDLEAAISLWRGSAARPVFIEIGGTQNDEDILRQLRACVANGADGIVLADCAGVADIQKLDVLLSVAEAEANCETARTVILAHTGQRPDLLLSPKSLAGVSSRLTGLLLDSSAGAPSENNDDSERLPAPQLYLRAAAVLKARQAGIDCLLLMPDDVGTAHGIAAFHRASLRDGFSGVVASHPVQLGRLVDL